MRTGWRLWLLLGVLGLGTSVTQAAAFDPALAFDKKCSSCHTIGNGVLKGPDLKGVTSRRSEDWLVAFIQSAATVIESGDAEAVKLYNEFGQKDMPDQRLTKDEVLAILKFIEGGGASTGGATGGRSATSATPQDILAGQNLYLGQTALQNGGTACISCHAVANYGPLGGGTLAKNLTHTYADYKDQGLDVALQKLAFPVMGEIFAGKPLTEAEIFQIKAFLYDADRQGVTSSNQTKKFAFLGVAGAALMLGIMDFAWRSRRKNSVRNDRGGLR